MASKITIKCVGIKCMPSETNSFSQHVLKMLLAGFPQRPWDMSPLLLLHIVFAYVTTAFNSQSSLKLAFHQSHGPPPHQEAFSNTATYIILVLLMLNTKPACTNHFEKTWKEFPYLPPPVNPSDITAIRGDGRHQENTVVGILVGPPTSFQIKT